MAVLEITNNKRVEEIKKNIEKSKLANCCRVPLISGTSPLFLIFLK